MESSFRRLLAAIESEREDIRNSWAQLQEDRDGTAGELETLRQDTEDWCTAEKVKIDNKWKQLDRLSERMGDIWPRKFDLVKINCSGQIYEVPRGALTSIEGSYLTELFSEENSKAVRPDADGFYYLDINPHCFALIVEYLLNRRLRIDAPLPVIPKGQQLNMELLAEAWQLKPFLRENRVNPVHTTSLHIVGNTVEATHPGWQVISSQYSLPLANPYYFEVKILKNPGVGSSGGMAIGIAGHAPTGSEVHTILLPDVVMYTSGNGLVGNVVEPSEQNNVKSGVLFEQGTTLGIRHDPATHSLQWYFNGQLIGTCVLKEDVLDDRMRLLFPVFALYVPGQVIQVEFRSSSAAAPMAIQDSGSGAPASTGVG